MYNWRLFSGGFQKWEGFWDALQMHYEPARDADEARQAKQADPNIKVLLYRNMRSIYTHAPEYAQFQANGWLLHNAQGEEITSLGFGTQRLVDLGNTAYQQWLGDWMKTTILKYGFDCGFLDDAIFGTREILYGMVGVTSRCDAQTACPPINPRTSLPYTNADWLSANLATLQRVKSVLGTIPLYANGTFNGMHFWRTGTHDAYVTLIQNSGIDGWMIEGFLNDGSGTYYSEDYWKQSVEYIRWIEANVSLQKRVFVATHWQDTIPSDILHDDFVLYVYASLLLAASPERVYYTIDQPENTSLQFHSSQFVQSLHKIDLGNPSGAYYVLAEVANARVYARQYEKGIVLVNPTANALAVTLPQTYKTLDGVNVTSLNMPAHRGAILLSQARKWLFTYWQDGDTNPTKTVVA